MKLRLFLFATLFLLFNSADISAQISEFKATFIDAQSNDQEVVVTLTNGNTYRGKVTSVDEESAGVQTKDGLFNFRYDRIKSVSIYNPEDKTSGWNDNPARNKLFIFQTGKTLEPGAGYYQNTYIFFSNFAYGITENISVDAGFSMIPGLGIENQLYSVGAKIGTSVSNTFFVSGNIKHYQVLDTEGSVTTLFGSGTFSKSRLDLTASAGVGLSGSENSDLILILGGQFRVSERFALLSENIILPAGGETSEALLSFGGRIIGSKSAFDLGFFTIEGEAFVPIVSYTIKF